MSNYKKDKSYIKQRLEYVNSVDYIIELENKIDNLQQENEKLKKENKTMLKCKINAIRYIGREMIHNPFYPASKVDGMKIVELLNGGDEE